jgi:hypothetical protein
MPWLDHGIHSVTVAIFHRNGMDRRIKSGDDDKR